MNHIARRMIAGVSATALFVSAVGFDVFDEELVKPVSAVSTIAGSSGKNGRSTGFPDPEQDTDKDGYYNTGYGLHTNKTATAVDDGTGRTFDVDLESWYVGENPVDVATVLDASGSMAWTVDTLDPLTVEDAIKAYPDELIDLENLKTIQNANGGYLPQNIVDKILIPDENHTDDTKLSYAGYKYYVYEARSSVSEFVPLGYWDGGEPTKKLEPIGYYKFNGSLKNEITGGTAKLISHAEDGGAFDEDSAPTVKVEPAFVSSDENTLDLKATAEKGALMLDIDAPNQFTIAMRIRSLDGDVGQSANTFEETPLFYIGNPDGSDYIKVVRSGSDARNIKVYDDTGSNIINYNGGSTKPFHDTDWVNLCLSYDGNTIKIMEYDKNTNTPISTMEKTTEFSATNAKIIIGGDNDGHSGNYSSMELTELCVFSKALDETELSKVNTSNDIKTFSKMNAIGNLVGYYDFGDTGNGTHEKLDNLVASESGTLKFIEQAQGGTFDVTKEVTSGLAEPVYKNGGLDLNETAKNGAVLLDAKPTADKYTISFQVEVTDTSNTTASGNIMYVGKNDANNYYTLYRKGDSSRHHLKFLEKGKSDQSPYNSVLNTNNTWKTITFVVEGKTVKFYLDGEKTSTSSESSLTLDYGSDPLSIILAGLWNTGYNRDDIFVKNVYVFDDALDAAEVKLVSEGKLTKDPEALSDGCNLYHAKTSDGTKDIAQISKSLAGNPDDEQRRGWYYVNSHSTWEDIEDCLQSGKQYLGVRNDEYLGKVPKNPSDVGGNDDKDEIADVKEADIAKDRQSNATVPSSWIAAREAVEKSKGGAGDRPTEEQIKYNGYYTKLEEGNDPTKTFTVPKNERNIQFYVDSVGYLRCFFSTGDNSWKSSSVKNSSGNSVTQWQYTQRTFCSLVYLKNPYSEKKLTDDTTGKTTIERTGNPTKYEELNYALNQFYSNLAKSSDLSNTAIVRFSTVNTVKNLSSAADNLKKLIMKDWTNYSDEYIESKTKETNYLQNLLEAGEKTSTETTKSKNNVMQYPYTMTGGTYTWTGLKSFYDNMAKTKPDYSGDTFTPLTSGNKVYDVANDARDKYLIIFTDGRDNTAGTSDAKYVKDYAKDSKGKVTSYGNFAPYDDKGKQLELSEDSQLAKAWADKLKDEGYTIFCVMMATGSISPTSNEEEYNSAYGFLETLAGTKDESEKKEDYISISGSSGNSLETAFADILAKIQKPREDYTVQDYIDPRFDLIDGDGDLYKLGANGVITKPDKSTVTVENYLDNPETAKGLDYTPIETANVTTGTGKIYYDTEKDMYYLRWDKQVIPMRNEVLDTDDSGETLDVWSATIRLKAKDDFIGGNNILTNGNEAGENLVYSEATIENMDKNPNLYFPDGEKHTLREKLQILSGTNRKINAVDAGNVSQAVYGDGIDIPSSGFPRVTVNVRLLKLNAKNLNDVIYMGEVISPTMMLADLENDYMTGSYYLQYLERYAYRIYGEGADDMPLIELLNKWLKINVKEEASKTFTIPYIYLPDPEYTTEGKLAKDGSGKVIIQNSTGADKDKTDEEIFADLNLRDVTGFITYTWKRDDNSKEPQQLMEKTNPKDPDKYDITKEYVVKNTNQIKYNLQLKFTPLKEGELKGFTLDNNFIKADATTRTGGDKFFKVEGKEFGEATEWSIESNRSDYLQAMVKEQHSYTPHVKYNDSEKKWKLEEGEAVSDKDTYDWNATYKPTAGEVQLLNDKSKNIKDFYTDTPNNVKLVGTTDTNELTDDKGAYKEVTDTPISITANTTYIKDVVNGALALELAVDGKYLQGTTPEIKSGKEYTFEATRYYDDPLDKLPYGDKTNMYADTGEADTTTGVEGKKYQLTFKVDDKTLPEAPKANRPETIWATLVKVEVENGSGKYVQITDKNTETNPYVGYTDVDALPIGTYVISTKDGNNSLTNEQFKIGTVDSESVNFAYLKLDNADASYTYDRFPENVYKVSGDAATDTKDGEYLIKNGGTDNSKKNKADNNRVKDADNQTLTFYLGTVGSKTVDKTLVKNTKGYDRTDKANSEKDYAKDRLGIIMLSKNNNSLSISKTVTNTEVTANRERLWEFKVEFTPKAGEDSANFETQNKDGFSLKWYNGDDEITAGSLSYDSKRHIVTTTFTEAADGSYTTTLSLKHGESVRIENLPEGTWQVVETDEREDIFYSAHNNMDDIDEYTFANSTKENIELTPVSYVDFVNEFPHELPSTGGQGTHKIIYAGVILAASASLYFLFAYRRFRRRRKEA